MSFVWPPLLASLLLIPAGFLVHRAIDRRRRGRVAALSSFGGGLDRSADGDVAPGRARSRLRETVPASLAVAALAVLAVAVARPQADVALPRVEGTVILTFDVSGSMAATDVEPNRMEFAKAVARATVAEQPDGVVIGVVAFSDAGLAVQPPTDDRAAVLAAIDRLEPALGTSLGDGMIAALDAIAKADAGTPVEYYSNRPPEPKSDADRAPGSQDSSVIVLLTDGENTARPDPRSVAATAAEHGVRVHTVGIGTAAGTTLDLDGFTVHTQLDAAALEEVAALTAGEYHHAERDAPMTWIYEDLARRLVLRTEAVELTALLAGVGVLLLVTGAAMSLVLRGRMP